MLESNCSLSLVGKAVQPNQEELIFEIEKESVFLRSELELEILNRNKCRRQIGDFISSTVVYNVLGAGVLTLSFGTDEGKKCQNFLKQHFGEKHNSVTRFFEFLEKAADADIEKFVQCIKIIDRERLKNIPTILGDATAYFLVTGLFFEPPIHDLERKKIFLQTVFTYESGYSVSHEELSEELYFFAQSPQAKEFFRKHRS